ncbi:MAG: ABC transporter ATP-binding protein [Pseudohongiellaceae bacterium]
MSGTGELLACRELAIAAGHRPLLRGLDLGIRAGDCLGILGCNGTGKTTLLHTLAGLHAPSAGHLSLQGRALAEWTGRALARQVGIVFQHHTDEMPATVMETVLLGRFPHSRAWQWENRHDREVAEQALQQMGLLNLAQRQVHSLSGGERQRLALAALLAQAPRVMLLDEPGNHLDIGFQLSSLSLLRDRTHTDGSALLFATHDINLAARYCERILLLKGDGNFLLGTAAEVLTEEHLHDAYGCRVRALPLPDDIAEPGTGYFYVPDRAAIGSGPTPPTGAFTGKA